MNEQDELKHVEAQITEVDKELQRLKEQKEVLIERRDKIKGDILAKENDIPHQQFYNGTYPWTEKIRNLLQKKFGHQYFRLTQEAALNCIISGHDSIVVMPAGKGKSLIYQLACLHLQGMVLVVVPLTSLMEDQIAAISKIDPQLPVYGVHVNTPKDDLNDIVVKMSFQNHHQSKLLLFVTADKIAKSKQFMAKVTKTFERKKLSLIVVDEAQCCAPNGSDYRTEYQALSTLRSSYPGVPMIALTSVANKAIVCDIASSLNLEKRVVLRQCLDLPNIAYNVEFVEYGRQNVIGEIATLINERYSGKQGIVFCFSVKDAEDVATVLVKDFGIKAKPYHHQLKFEYRSKVHNQWLSGKIQVVVATSTFGMGINNTQCEYVIHYSIPKSIQNYYIDAGRAGRNGQPANSHCLFKFQDVFRMSSYVFADKNGLRYLYKLINYCLNRTTCRRRLLHELLTEGFNEDAVQCSQEDSMCDNCKNKSTPKSIDVTEYVKLFSSILEENCTMGQRITGWKLMDVFRKRLSKESAPKRIRSNIGHIIVWSLCKGYLEEKFHSTPYSTISHLSEGPRMKRLLEGSEKAEFEFYDDKYDDKGFIDLTDEVAEPPSKIARIIITDEILGDVGTEDRQSDLQQQVQAQQQQQQQQQQQVHQAAQEQAQHQIQQQLQQQAEQQQQQQNIVSIVVGQQMQQLVQLHHSQPMQVLQVHPSLNQQAGQPILVQLVHEQQQQQQQQQPQQQASQPLDQLAVAVQQALQ